MFCRAVVDHSLGKDLPSISIESFECLPGRGLFATLSGIKVSSSHKISLTLYHDLYCLELSNILHQHHILNLENIQCFLFFQYCLQTILLKTCHWHELINTIGISVMPHHEWFAFSKCVHVRIFNR